MDYEEEIGFRIVDDIELTPIQKEAIQSAKAETYRDMLNSLLNDTNPYGIDEYAYMCNQIKGI